MADKGDKPLVFISYTWNETKEDVWNLVEQVLNEQSTFTTWLDKKEMYGDKYDRMREGIAKASLIVMFYNELYQSRPDCIFEVETAWKSKKPILFVKMQPTDDVKLKEWFKPIIGDCFQSAIDFYADIDAPLKIYREICRLLTVSLTPLVEEKARNSIAAICGVPKFAEYHSRPDLESKLQDNIIELCTTARGNGAYLLHGGGGIGKTTSLANVLNNSQRHLRVHAKLTHLFWLNCSSWSQEDYNEQAFAKALIEIVATCFGKLVGVTSLRELSSYFRKHEYRKPLVVLDDVFDKRILEAIKRYCPKIPCFALSRDADELSAYDSINKTIKVDPLNNDLAISMLENLYDLKEKISQKQLNDLAILCDGLPLSLSLVGGLLRNSGNACKEVMKHLIQSFNLGESKPPVGGSHATVKKLFEFSLERESAEGRNCFYATILYPAAKNIHYDNLAILWGISDDKLALAKCLEFGAKSLMTENQDSGCFTVHHLLHEAAIENALKKHSVASSLPQLRLLIATGLCCIGGSVEGELSILNQALSLKKRSLIETVLTQLDGKDSADLVATKTSNGLSYIHALYRTPWDDNGPPAIHCINHSYRVIYKWLQKARERALDALSVPNGIGEDSLCLMQQIIREEREMKWWSDRIKIILLLQNSGLYHAFRKKVWLRRITEEGGQIFKAVVTNQVENLKKEKAKAMKCKTRDCITPLMAAAYLGHLEIVQLLADGAADRNKNAKTPIMYAAQAGRVDALKVLLPKSDVTSRNVKGKTPLMYACESGSLACVQAILTKSGRGLETDNNGRDTLSYACERGHLDILLCIRQTLSIGNLKCDKDGLSGLHYAAKNGHLSIVEELFEMTIVYSKAGVKSPLMLAAEADQADVVRWISWKKFNLNFEKDEVGRTALMYAARQGSLSSVRAILDAAENSEDVAKLIKLTSLDARATAFTYAAQNGNADIARILLEFDASIVKDCDGMGRTPLLNAAAFGQVEMLKVLYEVDPGSLLEEDNYGNSALFTAVGSGSVEAVEFILSMIGTPAEQKKCLTAERQYGSTALTFTITSHNLAMAKFICSKLDKADINAKTGQSKKSALDLARNPMIGDPEIAAFLEQFK